MHATTLIVSSTIGITLCLAASVSAQDAPGVAPGAGGYSPYPEQTFPNQVFFGDTRPMLSPDDAFADFEIWDKGSFRTEAKTPDMLPREYARAAYLRGMQYEAELGENPFKFGLIGSTDAHTSLSTSREENFFARSPRWSHRQTRSGSMNRSPDGSVRKTTRSRPGKHRRRVWQPSGPAKTRVRLSLTR